MMKKPETTCPGKRRGSLPFCRALLVVMAACSAFALCACGAKGDEKGSAGGGQSQDGAMLIENAGVIEPGDRTDANHGNLAYDAYEFTARAFDRVRVEVATEEFSPLLKLVEVSTGAVLAEWDAQYPTGDEKALGYVIAGPGLYEARVYAMRSGKGAYTVKITVKP